MLLLNFYVVMALHIRSLYLHLKCKKKKKGLGGSSIITMHYL